MPSPVLAAVMAEATYLAVVGPGEQASDENRRAARRLGQLAAARNWIVLTGGRDVGVMAAAAEGASAGGGVVIGILPDENRRRAARGLTAALATGLGEARNAVLVSACDGLVACGMNAGTLSEIALAVRSDKPVALVGTDSRLRDLEPFAGGVVFFDAPEPAIEDIARRLANGRVRSGG